jgi:hypothetical protein
MGVSAMEGVPSIRYADVQDCKQTVLFQPWLSEPTVSFFASVKPGILISKLHLQELP